MSRIKLVITFLCCVFLITTAYAKQTAVVVYTDPVNALEKSIQKQLQVSDTVESMVTLSNDTFKLNKQLSIVFGGEEGPLFDPETNEILIPYTFIDEINRRFKAVKYAETGVSIEDASSDVLMHTLFHELAHALISMYELPIVGKEEDAADSLAVLLLVEYFEDGAEIAISAADLFDLESMDNEIIEEQDLWDEHSLDAQRFYTTLCHVYGSSPESYSDIPKQLGFSQERAEFCVDDYANMLNSWLTLLKPYIKN
ncbi:DUF4344 domain-containing metallopeptidase [Psychromonas ossibalaenae]|uniref:DUF4344 domain-containing metallopeptidase n=1 Tax=Psychromonas ossibalaenae TaxID=444922 RepID=UPI000362D02B|nr:DUF4344 domain-containing metallopeptidase [Psychromonas ossibalaenae]